MVLWKDHGHPIKGNLQIQCNPNQNSEPIFMEMGKDDLRIYMEAQKTIDGPSNPEQKEQCWREASLCLTSNSIPEPQ